MEDLGCVSGGKRNEYMLLCSALRYFYAVQIFFVDKDYQKAEGMASHHFLIRRRMSPSIVMENICLVNCDAWGNILGHFRSGHLMR